MTHESYSRTWPRQHTGRQPEDALDAIIGHFIGSRWFRSRMEIGKIQTQNNLLALNE